MTSFKGLRFCVVETYIPQGFEGQGKRQGKRNVIICLSLRFGNGLEPGISGRQGQAVEAQQVIPVGKLIDDPAEGRTNPRRYSGRRFVCRFDARPTLLVVAVDAQGGRGSRVWRGAGYLYGFSGSNFIL